MAIREGSSIENLRTTVLFACCTAFGLTLTKLLLPLEQFERQLRMMIAVLMMTAILVPLTKLDLSGFMPDLSAAETQSADLQTAAAQMQEQAASENIRNALNHALNEKDVPCRVLDVTLHIQPDGCISISEVTAEGNLLTGSVFLHEWLGKDVIITEGEMPDASDG